tara:strand:- start:1256 stop:1618 length:363 start_codon:yes stop_codon:yes gene_type:complete
MIKIKNGKPVKIDAIEQVGELNPSIEIVREEKLQEIKRKFCEDVDVLGVTLTDELNHNNANIKTTPEEKTAMAEFEALRLKLYDIKRLIRSRTDIEKLNGIEWESFTRSKWLSFFGGVSY